MGLTQEDIEKAAGMLDDLAEELPEQQAPQMVAVGARVDVDQRRVWITESMTTEVVADVIRSLLQLDEAEGDHIHLWVSTPGGDAEAVFGLLDVIAALDSPVVVVGFGLVASAGAYLLVGGDARVVYPNTQVMIHGPGMGLSGHGTLTVQELTSDLAHMRWLQDRMVTLLANRTGLTQEEAMRLLDDGQDHWYRGGQAAVAAGLADVVLEPEVSES